MNEMTEIAKLTDEDYNVLKNLFIATESPENTLLTHQVLMSNIKNKSGHLTSGKTIQQQIPDLLKIYICIQLLTHLHGIDIYKEVDEALDEIQERIMLGIKREEIIGKALTVKEAYKLILRLHEQDILREVRGYNEKSNQIDKQDK